MKRHYRHPDAPMLPGFTLVEVMAGLVIIGIMLGGILMAYNKTLEAITINNLKERAAAVAQRHMEKLLASCQEPDSVDLQGTDEIDPAFSWKLSLSREPIPGAKPPITLPNTVIKAVITVQSIDEEDGGFGILSDTSDPNQSGHNQRSFTTRNQPNRKSSIANDTDDLSETALDEPNRNLSTVGNSEAVREIARVELVRYIPWLNPLPGNTVAVPLTPKIGEEPEWFKELREQLGREPTMEEIIQKTLGDRVLPPEVKEALEQHSRDNQGNR